MASSSTAPRGLRVTVLTELCDDRAAAADGGPYIDELELSPNPARPGDCIQLTASYEPIDETEPDVVFVRRGEAALGPALTVPCAVRACSTIFANPFSVAIDQPVPSTIVVEVWVVDKLGRPSNRVMLSLGVNK